MKILITDINELWQKEYLIQNLPDHVLDFIEGSIKDVDLSAYSDTEVLVNFISSPIELPVFEALPDLKLITTRSTGIDHINGKVAEQYSVVVSNVPVYGENTVAEHAFTLMLALARKLPESLARVKEGEFNYHGLRGWDIKGKTLGVIGGGHIGINLVKMAKGFGMNVLVFDINPNSILADVLGFEYVALDELYSRSNVISLHVPLNLHTQHMINSEAIEKMRDGIYVINTARGGLIDTEALLQGLKSGKIAGAGLDVLEGEEFINEELDLLNNPECKDQLVTLLGDHLLMDLENVIVTPHNAFNSVEAVERILETTVKNIKAFAAGEPQNKVY